MLFPNVILWIVTSSQFHLLIHNVNQSSSISRFEDSHRNSMSKYLNTPEHFPSFNVHMFTLDSENSEDDSDLKVEVDQKIKTRSGKIYKTM